MPVNAGPPDESYDSNIEWLVDTLPTFMANDESSGNWHLMTPIGNQIDDLDADIEAVDRASHVQSADTIDQLEKLARMVEAVHRDGETKEHYRSRIFARYQLNTAEGTVGDLLQSVSTILDANIENIGYVDHYKEFGTPAEVGIVMPGQKVDQLNLTSDEIADILNDLAPAGYTVFGQTRGTLLYVTPSTYNNTSDWSQYDGYDGLDANGDPKGTGGTYAGIVN